MRYYGNELDVPTWANWLAADKDGGVYAYSLRPKKDLECSQWSAGEVANRYRYLETLPKAGECWKESLTSVKALEQSFPLMVSIALSFKTGSADYYFLVSYSVDQEQALKDIKRQLVDTTEVEILGLYSGFVAFKQESFWYNLFVENAQ